MGLMESRTYERGRDIVMSILAAGLAVAVILITWNGIDDGFSNNETQLLETAFGGFIGIIGSFIGYRAGERAAVNRASYVVPTSEQLDIVEPMPSPPQPGGLEQP